MTLLLGPPGAGMHYSLADQYTLLIWSPQGDGCMVLLLQALRSHSLAEEVTRL